MDDRGLEQLESLSDQDYKKIMGGVWSTVLKGLYSYHLKRWYKFFPSNDILILDGDLLTAEPWKIMKKVQDFLHLPQLIDRHSFVVNPKTGFYCLKISNKKLCLGKSKGRTRSLSGNSTLESSISDQARKILDDFFRPYNAELLLLTGEKFSNIK